MQLPAQDETAELLKLVREKCAAHLVRGALRQDLPPAVRQRVQAMVNQVRFPKFRPGKHPDRAALQSVLENNLKWGRLPVVLIELLGIWSEAYPHLAEAVETALDNGSLPAALEPAQVQKQAPARLVETLAAELRLKVEDVAITLASLSLAAGRRAPVTSDRKDAQTTEAGSSAAAAGDSANDSPAADDGELSEVSSDPDDDLSRKESLNAGESAAAFSGAPRSGGSLTVRSSDLLRDLEALPVASLEWEAMEAFVARAADVVRRKADERRAGQRTAELLAGLDGFAVELAYLDMTRTDAWSASRLAMPALATASGLLDALLRDLTALRAVRARQCDKRQDEQMRREEQQRLEEACSSAFDQLRALFARPACETEHAMMETDGAGLAGAPLAGEREEATEPAGSEAAGAAEVQNHDDKRAAASTEPPRAEPPRAEPPRAEPPRAEPPRAEPPRAEPARGAENGAPDKASSATSEPSDTTLVSRTLPQGMAAVQTEEPVAVDVAHNTYLMASENVDLAEPLAARAAPSDGIAPPRKAADGNASSLDASPPSSRAHISLSLASVPAIHTAAPSVNTLRAAQLSDDDLTGVLRRWNRDSTAPLETASAWIAEQQTRWLMCGENLRAYVLARRAEDVGLVEKIIPGWLCWLAVVVDEPGFNPVEPALTETGPMLFKLGSYSREAQRFAVAWLSAGLLGSDPTRALEMAPHLPREPHSLPWLAESVFYQFCSEHLLGPARLNRRPQLKTQESVDAIRARLRREVADARSILSLNSAYQNAQVKRYWAQLARRDGPLHKLIDEVERRPLHVPSAEELAQQVPGWGAIIGNYGHNILTRLEKLASHLRQARNFHGVLQAREASQENVLPLERITHAVRKGEWTVDELRANRSPSAHGFELALSRLRDALPQEKS